MNESDECGVFLSDVSFLSTKRPCCLSACLLFQVIFWVPVARRPHFRRPKLCGLLLSLSLRPRNVDMKRVPKNSLPNKSCLTGNDISVDVMKSIDSTGCRASSLPILP